MELHLDRQRLFSRMENSGEFVVSPFVGDVFRFLQPAYSSVDDQFSGSGGWHLDGRWGLKGVRKVSYASCLPETALQESLAAHRYYGFPDSTRVPLVLVAAEAKLKKVVNLCDGSVRKRLQLSETRVRTYDWRSQNQHERREAITQAWGWAIAEWGAEGILCPSAAHSRGQNLIVFPQNLLRGSNWKAKHQISWPR